MDDRSLGQRHSNIPIFIPHLGCPNDCIYCDQKIIAHQAVAPAPEQIAGILERHLTTIPAGTWTEAAFFGGSFTAIDPSLQEAYLQVVQPYLQQGVIKGIRVSTRPDCIDDNNLDLLSCYGVRMVELGVQSMCDEVLKTSGRGYDSRTVRHSCQRIQAKNLQLGIQLMIGLPGDTLARDIASARESAALQPQAVRIYPTLVLSGTKLAAMYDQGRYTPLDMEEAIRISKAMYLLFCLHDIPVIRMGLHPGPELQNPGIVKAGPFHSSFGEMVEQAVFRDHAYKTLQSFHDSFGIYDELCLHVNRRDLSKMIGQRRSNIIWICQQMGFDRLDVKGNLDQTLGSIGVGRGDEPARYVLSRRQYLEGLSW